MIGDSTEFLVKTNKDVNEWMDSFYSDGRKAKFRLHCQWAWQENERQHRAIEAEMLAALEAARNMWGDYLPPGNSNAMKAMRLVDAAIAKVKGVSQ